MDSLSAAAGTASLALLTKDDHILPASSLLRSVPKDVNDLRTKIFNIQEPIIYRSKNMIFIGRILTISSY
jgi:hypothetical protein